MTPIRTTLGKALYHLEQAEWWQGQAEAWEKWATDKAKGQQQGRMRRKDSEHDPGYVAGTLLANHHFYLEAVGNRNGHQRRAEIYLLAHSAGILETRHELIDGKIRVKHQVRTDDGL